MRSLAGFAFALAMVFASSADAKIIISINKSTQRMVVSVDGKTRWVWPVSTGRRGHATPAGSFQPFRMERDHFSREWDDAPMPHSIFFTKRGHAIHGSYHTRSLGSPASAGCVRLAPANARALFELVQRRGVGSATVIIAGVEPSASAPAVARRTPRAQPSQRPAPRQSAPRTLYAPRYDDEVEYVDPRTRRPAYQPPVYGQPLPGYEPPGSLYAPRRYD